MPAITIVNNEYLSEINTIINYFKVRFVEKEECLLNYVLLFADKNKTAYNKGYTPLCLPQAQHRHNSA